jgi:predicted lipoprotein
MYQWLEHHITGIFKGHVLWMILGVIALTGCEKDQPIGGEDSSGAFDQEKMLKHLGEDLILPRYKNLHQSVKQLNNKAQQFTDDPKKSHLTDLQEAWKAAYRDWQYCSVFELGPAKDLALRKKANTFPADTPAIDSSIITGNYDLTDLRANAEKGFPAIEYLIFDRHHGADTVLRWYTSAPHAGNRKSYLTDATQQLKKEVTQVYEDWQPDKGNYLKTFKQNTGTDAGSSVSLLVNELNFDWEILKNNKIGIPLGKKSLGEKFPEKVEAYFSGYSLELALAHVRSIEQLFQGHTGQQDGPGFEEYLQHLGAEQNGDSLHTVINEQYQLSRERLQAIPEPLSVALTENTQKVEAAYEAIQQQVVYTKTDMPSELGVRISYQDNDND